LGAPFLMTSRGWAELYAWQLDAQRASPSRSAVLLKAVEDPGSPLAHAQLLLAKIGWRTAPRARGIRHAMHRSAAIDDAALLAWARKSGAFIVEDDCTSGSRYSGPPLASLPWWWRFSIPLVAPWAGDRCAAASVCLDDGEQGDPWRAEAAGLIAYRRGLASPAVGAGSAPATISFVKVDC
jgi:hypothetical protein